MKLTLTTGGAWRAVTPLAIVIGLLGAPFGPALADDFQSVCAQPHGVAARILAANPATLQRVLGGAQGGDVVALEAGNYGPVSLSGANSDFITVTAARGGRAVLSSLRIKGARWIVRGLIIDGGSSPESQPAPTQPGKWPSHDWMVRVDGGKDVILEGNTITSLDGPYPWKEESPGVEDLAPLWSGVLFENASCATFSNNTLNNVFNGIAVEGDQKGDDGKYFRVTNNKINNFAGDGIDHAVSSALISHNLITNGHEICEYKCIHADGIQGWNFHDLGGIVNYDVRIDGNIIIQQAAPDLVLPGDDVHGITIFDGAWRNVDVVNNVVITGSWHGITIGGADGLRIMNNTVVASGSRRTWISAGGATHQHAQSKDVIVRNNISSSINPARDATTSMKTDHNLTADNPRGLFVEFDTAHARYDLHPRASAASVGHGSSDLAPSVDIDGNPRGPRIDIGAYQRSEP